MQFLRKFKSARALKALTLGGAFVFAGCNKTQPTVIDSAFFLCTTNPAITATLKRSLLDSNEYQINVGTASIGATVSSQLDRADQVTDEDTQSLAREAKLIWPKSLSSPFTGNALYGLSGPTFVRFHHTNSNDIALIDHVGKSFIRCPRGGL